MVSVNVILCLDVKIFWVLFNHHFRQKTIILVYNNIWKYFITFISFYSDVLKSLLCCNCLNSHPVSFSRLQTHNFFYKLLYLWWKLSLLFRCQNVFLSYAIKTLCLFVCFVTSSGHCKDKISFNLTQIYSRFEPFSRVSTL